MAGRELRDAVRRLATAATERLLTGGVPTAMDAAVGEVPRSQPVLWPLVVPAGGLRTAVVVGRACWGSRREPVVACPRHHLGGTPIRRAAARGGRPAVDDQRAQYATASGELTKTGGGRPAVSWGRGHR